ncbi:GumC family protein [Croceivirga thetidis]|uniref:non-specific protein-tyrosine kinase n=1 Tax=Croceivirga thetidis TaxID=2721623 RepID=A0ABX1GR08_9FLAO|nr:polysaccharide biosynthesis tyrosine autokinase [Croceivirga thetidis]NKI32024.1 polysaccharide biosynthesis tyrosine autokinase [Croceivirga thetidis]
MERGDLDLNEIVNSYLKHWKWFVLSICAAFLMAFLYLRYSVPKFEVAAKIQIIEDKSSGSELSVLQELDVLSGREATKITDEVELLKSRDNFIKVVRKLKLNIEYNLLGNVRSGDLYNNHPFEILMSSDTVPISSSHDFFVRILNENEFMYSLKRDQEGKKMTFGTEINADEIGDITLVPNLEKISRYKNKILGISIKEESSVADSYRGRVSVVPKDKISTVLNISMKDAVPERAIDVINLLIEQNNENEVESKKAIADRTSRFIEDRIADIYSNLSTIDQESETFKESRGIADLGSQSNVNFQQSAASEQELRSANIQLNIAESMQSLINQQDGFEVIPNVGLSDPSIDNAATRYNELVAQRNRLLESSNEKNPIIVNLDQQLSTLKRTMQSSLNNVTNNLNLRVNSLSKQLSQINSRIYAAPGNETALRDISRKQQTTESLYLYLLQKSEEAQIAFASAAPKSKIINRAHLVSNTPVEPKNKIIYLAAILAGLMIPFAIIYLNGLLDNKVSNMVTLQKYLGNNFVVLAEVPKVNSKEDILVKKGDRSILSESLRILRTNLDYILKSRGKSSNGKVTLVTSSVSGEGKTFISSNLSMTLASAGKKVLLLGADIRNPKVFEFFKSEGVNNRAQISYGLTDYLFQEDINLKDLIHNIEENEIGIDVIYSGKIPPNPSELLLSERLEGLFENLRAKYDYIIVDSAPILAVTDSLLLEKYTDQVIYVTKSKSTERKVLEFPLNLHKEGKIRNLSFVVNSVKETNLGYGGKYGYGYGQTQKKWWQFDIPFLKSKKAS